MIRPEQKVHVVKSYLTKTQKNVWKMEAKKRGIGISELIKVAIFDYLSPTKGTKTVGIV